MTPLEPGLEADLVHAVAPADTAASLGSGDVAVLGTPRLLALAEEATVAAVRGALQAGRTTVGTRVELAHLLPSAVGTSVRVHARLVHVDGRLLRFEVTAFEVTDIEVAGSGRLLAHGHLTRVVVDRDRFLARLP